MNDQNFTNDEHNIADQWGQAFAEKFLDYIRARMVKIQEETGHMYNLEATPAESATYRFAREDKKRYKGIIQAGTEENPYYTNSSQLLSALPTTRSKLWIYSLICRPSIPAVPSSTCIWASGFLRPKFAATLSAKF